MNGIFSIIFIICTGIVLFYNPNRFLEFMMNGAMKSGSICVGLMTAYSCWAGIMQIWEDSGFTKRVSKLIRPITKRIFKIKDIKTLDAIGMNLSANMLGLGGAATPYGIKAAELIDKEKYSYYNSSMLFVINATSVQIIPVTVISLRSAFKSCSPGNIIIPTLISSTISTILAIILIKIMVKHGKK